ncbi:hypothetical protein [Sinorhizobium meliloti]|uniref:hypothetical protein n=1 Tax=Rhizobium meliloti TaxID=382 RepID=UPI0012D3D138|nr:hypothetical protein [Sinorhizobium meliloti]
MFEARVDGVIIYQGQEYTCTALEPYRRQDGTLSELARWTASCAHCGEPFTITTPVKANRFQPNRRCPAHHWPGHKVTTPSRRGK